MAYTLPQTTFDPHPEGIFEGIILEVRDGGKMDTQWGSKHRLAVVIENQELKRDDGQSWLHFDWCNLATGKNARLTELRQKLLKRTLTREELEVFDENIEMVGKRVRYTIVHNFENERTFANLATWSLIPEDSDSTDEDGYPESDEDSDSGLPS